MKNVLRLELATYWSRVDFPLHSLNFLGVVCAVSYQMENRGRFAVSKLRSKEAVISFSSDCLSFVSSVPRWTVRGQTVPADRWLRS